MVQKVKLQKTSNKLVATIPVHCVKKLNWKKGDVVKPFVNKKGNLEFERCVE